MMSTLHTHCRACGDKLPPPFLDLGRQPLANNLCTEAEHHDEMFPMRLCRCGQCGLLQLDTIVDPTLLYSHYLYTPSQSKKTLEHFRSLANEATRRCDDVTSPRAIDIGSNDGALLSMLRPHGFHVHGIDPAKNLAEEANRKGIPTDVGFFDDTYVEKQLHDHGPADLVTACNVFAHTPDWNQFARCAARLLTPKGLLAIEFPYGPVMLRDGTFDLIYFEHCSYPSIRPLKVLFEHHGLHVLDVEDLPDIHGGSVRVWLGFDKTSSPQVGFKLAEEADTASIEACRRFEQKTTKTALDFRVAVQSARSQGRTIVGYAAPAKCVTLLEAAAHLDSLAFIVDDNPLKQGRMLPSLHIPVRHRHAFIEETINPENLTVVVFAWNVVEDILPKLPRGCEVIVPMPDVRVFHT